MTPKLSHIITAGFAMFAMFFGAGNIVFPLALGQHAGEENFFAILGLLITAVGVPFLGVIAMTLYNGNYKTFFSEMGTKTGFLISLVIMGLIGPFGAIPRCIALSYSTTHVFFPFISLEVFSALSCVLIFLFTYRKSSIMEVLGNILTPFLILSLAIVIIKGLLNSSPALPVEYSSSDVFLKGLKEGYQTMDLLSAFFFSSVIIIGIKKFFKDDREEHSKSAILALTLKSSLVGAFLLSIAYVGFSYVSSLNTQTLNGIPPDQMIAELALQTLGPYAGIIASTAVALACLTTAIALAAVSAEYIYKDLSFKKISYFNGLLITLIISYFVSTLNFTGIVKLLAPILEVCYPALILLTLLNIRHKIWHVQTPKWPVWLLFGLSVLNFSYNYFYAVF